MVSDVTFVDNDMECTPISIAPENVSLVQEYDTSEDQGEHLFKNTQHVIMV